MSDYTKTTDFAAKDALASGNPAKAAKGTEVDTEFDNIQTAVNTKYDVSDRDVANGLAPLDAGTLVPVANLPVATEIAIGALQIATSAETDTGTDDVTIVTPLKLQQILDSNAGLLDDLKDLADPAANRLLYWDDTDTALEYLTVGPGLDIDQPTNTIGVDMFGMQNLADPGADRLYAFDNVSNLAGFITVTAGLELDNASGQIRILDKAASTTEAIDISTGDITLDFSALTNDTIADTAATDSIVYNNGGVLRQMDIQDMGVRVVEETAVQTFALDDANTLQLLTGSTNRIWDIPTNAAVAYGIGTIIYVGCRDTAVITLSPNTSAVRLTSVLGSDVGPSAGDTDVTAGGVAVLIKVATNEWMLAGEIA